ncbi:aminotransferase [Demequina sp. SYSU T00068]|uniref:aminotransferase n=1 Tax=Demequina lignilytica TaxID=3051663 RepID=UPI002607D0EA|nr:aminotransferase [Demequina sp. SYSU T00068]MDN4490973.1 aminotransferase [Demequina sp. SYSU T00068]
MDTTASFPRLDHDAATALVRQAWGLDVTDIRDLGSNEDQNLLATLADGRRALLKVSHPGIAPAALDAQHAAVAHLSGRGIGALLPSPWPALDGGTVVPLAAPERPAHARVLDFLDGTPPGGARRLPSGLAASLGAVAGRVVAGLEGWSHEALSAGGPWDLREASAVVAEAVPLLDAGERDRVAVAMARADAALASLADALPVQPIHGDLTEDNVVLAADGALAGVIDLGDLGTSWRVAELAIALCALLHRGDAAMSDVLAAAAAFDREAPLTEPELRALWPLVVRRAAVLVAAGARVRAEDPGNAYAEARRLLEARMLETALRWASGEAELLLRDALGRVPAVDWSGARPLIDLGSAAVIDLSVTSAVHDSGAWLEPYRPMGVLAAARDGAGAAVTRYGEHRLDVQAGQGYAPRSYALAIEGAVDGGAVLTAPCDGWVEEARGAVRLTCDVGPAILLTGATALVEGRVAAGEPLARVRDNGIVGVQASAVADAWPPARVAAGHEGAWRRLCPDPSALLGRKPAVASSPDEPGLLAARTRAFAPVQEHYYEAPPRIERGWRHHLIDVRGRGYLDMVNNVAILGHGEPRIADAVDRQLRLLNTNSRFHYGAVVELSEALAARAPEGLDTVLLVNSGSEAVDLALRMVRAATGRSDVLALTEAYHGWTVGSDAVSTSLGDNPHALATRPDWVHLLDAPNAYRGRHRGPDAGRYLDDALGRLEELDSAGVSLAGLIAEPIFGNGGGILLPGGYLAGLASAVRERGGLVISDEVQVGYGRLGAHFWGFEQQGLVPDLIAVAKAIGNGHPLGAVITTRAIAEAFAVEGSFFASAGGSPVSCVVGSTVLRVLDEDGLQENARVVGALLADGLRLLTRRHPALGAVHGMGLYLGVEVVAGGPDAPDPVAAREICEDLLTEGVIVQPTGDHKNVLKIKPPLTIDAAAVRRFLGALGRVMELREARAAL